MYEPIIIAYSVRLKDITDRLTIINETELDTNQVSLPALNTNHTYRASVWVQNSTSDPVTYIFKPRICDFEGTVCIVLPDDYYLHSLLRRS